ncbi:MAG: alpha/beta hydrolase [Virgibacillus proomii]|jgi:alpha-beta hydrolase superfamily lysophospholipase
MKKQTFWYRTPDNLDIHVKKWELPSVKAKAVIQIAHGMMEHIERYDNFATYLTSHGFIVYGNDHRGHGETGKRQGMLGYFADQNGFFRAVDDFLNISKQIKKKHPELPLYLFGHSMGSFIVRSYIQTHSNLIAGAILSGTGYFPLLKTIVGREIASFLPPKEKSPFMNKLVFGSFNRKVKKPNTGFDWLSNSRATVDDYMQDPYTGFVPTGKFFYDLLDGIISIQSKEKNKRIRQDLPLLLISGEQDPVGDYAKGIWKTADLYKQAGLIQITTMLFSDGRHELINDSNNQEVYNAMVHWINTETI